MRGALAIGVEYVKRTIMKRAGKRLQSMNRRFCLFLAVVIFSGLLAMLLAAIEIYRDSAELVEVQGADVAIVLGAATWNGAPSPVFERRINYAITLYEEGIVRKIIFTGGLGRGESTPESVAAKREAVTHGVDVSDVFIETLSHTTEQNLANAKQIMEQEGLVTSIIVSDPLHMRRSLIIAHDLGIEAYPAPVPFTLYKTWRTKLPMLIRESFYLTEYRSLRCFSKLLEKLIASDSTH